VSIEKLASGWHAHFTCHEYVNTPCKLHPDGDYTKQGVIYNN